jgi:serine protease inhibitor
MVIKTMTRFTVTLIGTGMLFFFSPYAFSAETADNANNTKPTEKTATTDKTAGQPETRPANENSSTTNEAKVDTAEKPAQPPTTVATEINKLGFRLLKNSQESNSGNILYSPVSIYTSLAILRYGANPQDKDYLSRLAEFPSDQRLKLEIYILHRLLSSDISSAYKERINYSLWIDKNAGYLKQAYNDVKKYYPVKKHSTDFARQPYDAIAKINKYITQDTTVNRCMYTEDVDKRTALVLTGVLGMNGSYPKRFKLIRSRPANADNHLNWYTKVSAVEFRGKFPYFENDQYKAVILPFKNKNVSLTLIVPKNAKSKLSALHGIESQFDSTALEAVHKNAKIKSLTVLLPKFRFESLFDHKDLFSLLGQGKQNGNQGRYVLRNTTFKHKVMFGLFDDVHWSPNVKRSLPSLKRGNVVNFNRPFLYVIRHQPSKLALMIGRVSDPKAWINQNEYHSLIGSWRTAYDLDGDGHKDKIDYDYTGGENCCYQVSVTLTSTEKTLQLPFEVEGGYPTGLNLSNPRRFNIIKGKGHPPRIYMEIMTKGNKVLQVPAKWKKQYGFNTNWILISFDKGKMKVEDFIK